MASARFVAIVGPASELDRPEGAARILRELGAEVRTLDLWDDPGHLFRDDREAARVVLVEAGARPDIADGVLRELRREGRLESVGAIVAVSHDHVARLAPTNGFDDFVLVPYVPAELYARIRAVEWRRSEFATEERVKVGSLVVDRSAHEVTMGGTLVSLTAREFALLSYLCDRRGKVVSRKELLTNVWGNDYEGGARTVDIHVRRLRAKLGATFALSTLRGAGYKLAAVGGVGGEGPGPASAAGIVARDARSVSIAR